MTHRINPRTGNVITAAGVEIGSTYQARPKPLGSNALRIQAALLASDRPLPGFWGRSGGGSIDTLLGCTGGCHQGRRACDCETELACEVGPDAYRNIAPPRRERRLASIRNHAEGFVMAVIAGAVFAALTLVMQHN